MPVAWEHRIVGPAVMAWFLPPFFKDGVDLDVINAAHGPYEPPNILIDYVRNDPPPGLLAGNWRGVGETRNCFVVETAIDELARRAGRDPVAYRRALLKPGSRMLAVLDRVASASGWDSPTAPGRGRGVAVLEGFGSFIGLVAEAEMTGGEVHVPKVTAVIDCGRAVNPNIVKQQIEGGIIYGLSAALWGRVTLKDGAVEQSNFHDYRVVRMNEAPAIEVIILDTGNEPGGVGEPGTAVLAPAVCNAVFAATGRRVRSLPLEAALTEVA
jgi:isoquinoline 1-oxidoreductase beta subunit